MFLQLECLAGQPQVHPRPTALPADTGLEERQARRGITGGLRSSALFDL